MDIPAHILALGMTHRFVWEINLVQLPIAPIAISRHQRYIRINRLLHEASKRVGIDGLNLS